MTHDEIVKLMHKAGVSPNLGMHRFAQLVARAEREACAKVCDDESMHCESAVERAEPDEVSAIRSTAWKISICAAAIRARGER